MIVRTLRNAAEAEHGPPHSLGTVLVVALLGGLLVAAGVTAIIVSAGPRRRRG